MESQQVTKENIHLAVAVLLERQSVMNVHLKAQDGVLEAIRVQTTLTNGKVARSSDDIKQLKEDASASKDRGELLDGRVRTLEDKHLTAASRFAGVTWLGGILWTIITSGIIGIAFTVWRLTSRH